MADYLIQDTTLGAIANAINAKTGGSSALTPSQMVTEIGSIQTGGGIMPVEVQYTHAQDWLSANGATSGTAAAIVNTYCNSGDGLYHILCTDNNASTKRFDEALVALWGTIGMTYSVRDTTNASAASMSSAANRDLFIAAGATISVTFIPRGDVQ